MSRVGRSPIPVPSGVKVTLADDSVTVTGPQGTLARELPGGISISQDGDVLVVERPDDEREPPGPARADPLARGQHGDRRDRGLHQGARDRRRRATGPRPRAPAPSSWRSASRHPVSVDAPEGITFEVPVPTRIVVKGIDKEKVGQVAADIRKIRKPEPYKGKGVRYAGERVLRKAGKAAK